MSSDYEKRRRFLKAVGHEDEGLGSAPPVSLSPEQQREKERLIKEGQQSNEARRREFLERQALGREEKPRGKFDRFKEKLEEVSAPINNAGQRLAESATHAKEDYEVYKQSREVAKFQKAEAKAQRASAIQKAAEIRKYGRELTPEERDRLVQFRIDEEARKAERKEKLKERLGNARVQISEIADQSSNNLSKLGGDLRVGSSNPGGLANSSGISPMGEIKRDAIGTPAGEVNAPKRDPLLDMFMPRRSAEQGGVDPVAELFSLKGVGGAQLQQPQAQAQGSPGGIPQRDPLMEAFSLKGFGDPEALFMKTGNFFGQQQQQAPPNTAQKVTPPKKFKKKKK